MAFCERDKKNYNSYVIRKNLNSFPRSFRKINLVNKEVYFFNKKKMFIVSVKRCKARQKCLIFFSQNFYVYKKGSLGKINLKK